MVGLRRQRINYVVTVEGKLGLSISSYLPLYRTILHDFQNKHAKRFRIQYHLK